MNDETANDGGPAFPAPRENRSEGMSLRAYLAGQALTGMLARENYAYANASIAACRFADSVIKELGKEGAE